MADKQLDACISEVARKFQATGNVRFQLKEWQVTAVKSLLLPPFSLIRDFGKQTTHRNVSKISVSLTYYQHIGSKFTNHSLLASRREGQKVTLVAVIGGFRSDLSITCKTDGNFENASVDVLFFKVAYQ